MGKKESKVFSTFQQIALQQLIKGKKKKTFIPTLHTRN